MGVELMEMWKMGALRNARVQQGCRRSQERPSTVRPEPRMMSHDHLNYRTNPELNSVEIAVELMGQFNKHRTVSMDCPSALQ